MSRKHTILLLCLAALVIYKTVMFISYINPEKINIATWNVQTFFDAEFSGSEYSEYASAKNGWSAEKYYTRLLRLADALDAIDADIIALEEIENLNVVHDIANVMPYMTKLRYAVFACQPGSALGVAVFSRWPITSAKAHQIQLPQTRPETLRPIFEVHVKVAKKDVAVLVNHWKSKASGGETGGILRQCQQALLAGCIAELKQRKNYDNDVITALGDFNQKTEEFQIDYDAKEVALNGVQNTEKVKSVWFESAVSGAGYYFFRDSWEQIDHIFLASDNICFNECGTVTKRMFLRQDGTPNAYKMYTGTGLSDHLPLKAEICLR